jgi:Fe2+ transport system protein FeoA
MDLGANRQMDLGANRQMDLGANRRQHWSVMDLSQVKEGQNCTIDRVGGSGNFRRRVLEMGIIKGTIVHVEKYAPLKDPLELIVKGYHVSLRVEDAAQIKVTDIN